MGSGDTRGAPEANTTLRSPEAVAPIAPAWEQVEAGRYMPRRIRGSFPGRELG